MNGVTGRMGTNQHLMRSIVEIIRQGGVHLGPNETIMPDPILVGRNENKLKKLCAMSGIEKYTTDLDSVLKDPAYTVYFDAQTTGRRADAVKKAADALSAARSKARTVKTAAAKNAVAKKTEMLQAAKAKVAEAKFEMKMADAMIAALVKFDAAQQKAYDKALAKAVKAQEKKEALATKKRAAPKKKRRTVKKRRSVKKSA